MTQDPNLLTTSTNRNLLQPTKDKKKRRQTEIKSALHKGKHRGSSSSGKGSQDRRSAVGGKIQREPSASSSSKSGRSQLVDLIVEDTEAEEAERVRARKEGGSEWNEDEQKHFV